MNNNRNYYEAKRKNPILKYAIIWGVIIVVMALIFAFSLKPKRYAIQWSSANELQENLTNFANNENVVVEQIDHGYYYVEVYFYEKTNNRTSYYVGQLQWQPNDTKMYKEVRQAIEQGQKAFLTAGKSKIPYNLIVATNAPTIGDYIIAFLPITIIVIVMIVMFRGLKNAGGAGGSALDFGKSKARIEDASKVRFSDVAGCDDEKKEMEEIVDYLKNPKKYAKSGARIPKGVILKGPPGTGKTLLAKAVAGEANVPFYYISGSDFLEMFVGVGASRVRDMFKKAKMTAPCIVFIDEIDAVARQRGTGLGGGHDEREQTLNQLLVEMDGFESNSGVMVLAATNRVDVLDPALLRPGRFDRQISVNLPDLQGRIEILKVHSRNKTLASDVSLEAIAKRTPSFSGAELENVMNEAAILSVRNKHDKISNDDIDEAIDRVMAGPAKKSKIISDRAKKMVAYHEAGHAVIGLKIAESEVVQKITIIPRGDAGGYVLMTPKDESMLQTRGELMAKITSYLAGRASEEIFFDDVTTGAHSDIERATKIARLMVTELGMSELGPVQYENDTQSVFLGRDYASSKISGEVANEIDKQVRKIIDECMERAHNCINENKDILILIAETLLKYETITADEINYLVEHGSLDEYKEQSKRNAMNNPEIVSNEESTNNEPGEKTE